MAQAYSIEKHPTAERTPPVIHKASAPKWRTWAGHGMTGLVVLFLTFDSVSKFINPPQVAQAFAETGWPIQMAAVLGTILLSCTALYVIPRTSVLGAILLSGYLGGAVATHLRLGDPLFSHVLFPVYMGVLAWGGLYLREERLKALIPLRG